MSTSPALQQTIAIAAINPTAGDLPGNLSQIQSAIRQAIDHGADLVVFSELALSGCRAQDWLLSPDFLQACHQALEPIQAMSTQIGVLVGAPEQAREGVFNSAFFFAAGTCQAVYRKQKLPNYGVFDEKRYFLCGDTSTVITHRGFRYGLLLCEDLWYREPTEQAVKAGADLLLSLHASPYDMYKHGLRKNMLSRRAKDAGRPFIYAHHVGGEGELIYDGGSMAVNADGTRVFQAPCFHPDLAFLHLIRQTDGSVHIVPHTVFPTPQLEESLHQALVLGLRDFCHKQGLAKVWVPLTPDLSALVTTRIARDALGPDRVSAWIWPQEAISPAAHHALTQTCHNWGITPVQSLSLPAPLAPELLEGCSPLPNYALQQIAESQGGILLNTVDKTCWALGDAPGNPAGHFSVVKDLWYSLVIKLAAYLGCPSHFAYTPREVPPHEAIVKAFVDARQPLADIATQTHHPVDTVHQVIRLLMAQEKKRQYAPPGIRVTPRAFGTDWRYPGYPYPLIPPVS